MFAKIRNNVWFTVVLVGFVSMLLFFSSCQFVSLPAHKQDDVLTIPTDPATPQPTPEPVKAYTNTASLIAVGDIMMHQPQIDRAYQAATKTYDMTEYFSEVRHLLHTGDWVVANLETTLAGADAGGYSGYPMFNSPAELADAIKDAGFNIITTANNHSLDRHEKGVVRTIERLDERGLLHTGTFATMEHATKKLIVSKNDISIGFLAYTYGTNGIPFPEGKNYLVNLIDLEKIKADILATRQMGADLVSVSLHFGNEYQRMPSEQQISLATQVIQAGADLILGSHPHVVQPIQWVDVTNADGSIRRGLIVYSMGNFISSQIWDYKDVGVVVQVQVSKKFPEGIAQIDSYQATPTFVYRDLVQGKRRLTIMPLDGNVDRFATYQMDTGTIKKLISYQTEMQAFFTTLETMQVSNK